MSNKGKSKPGHVKKSTNKYAESMKNGIDDENITTPNINDNIFNDAITNDNISNHNISDNQAGIQNFKKAGMELLQIHAQLFEKLIQIPQNRKITFRIDVENGLMIGKPRFDPAEYQWPTELLQKLRDHLQEIWNFFDKYSFWFDKSIYPLLNWEERRISNDSIIYLLQHDVWGASAVYGAYLIEKETNTTTMRNTTMLSNTTTNGNIITVSYYRREKKIKSFNLGNLTDNQLEEWIKQDAVRQIADHFTFLWQKLETEIQVCMEERFQKKEREFETPQYLINQFQICKKFFSTSKEACLLTLGRIAEHWLKLALSVSDYTEFSFLIGRAFSSKVIDENERKMFDKIRTHYNWFKHNTSYKIEECPLKELLETFEIYLDSTKVHQ